MTATKSLVLTTAPIIPDMCSQTQELDRIFSMSRHRLGMIELLAVNQRSVNQCSQAVGLNHHDMETLEVEMPSESAIGLFIYHDVLTFKNNDERMDSLCIPCFV